MHKVLSEHIGEASNSNWGVQVWGITEGFLQEFFLKIGRYTPN